MQLASGHSQLHHRLANFRADSGRLVLLHLQGLPHHQSLADGYTLLIPLVASPKNVERAASDVAGMHRPHVNRGAPEANASSPGPLANPLFESRRFFCAGYFGLCLASPLARIRFEIEDSRPDLFKLSGHSLPEHIYLKADAIASERLQARRQELGEVPALASTGQTDRFRCSAR